MSLFSGTIVVTASGICCRCDRWVVSGTITEPMSPVMCAVATHTNELGNLMEQCFTTEHVSNTPSWSSEERACEDHDSATTTREEDGRYMVQLPRKPEMIGKLGDSTTIALRRILALERRLQREPDTQRAYVDFMDEYLCFSHTSKVAASSKNVESFYLSHHLSVAIIKCGQNGSRLFRRKLLPDI